MASTVPAKSQPLHNFTLPHLKWNKDGHSTGHHHRRRSVKSPSRKPNTPSASPIRQSPLRDSVSATPPRYQSPLRDPAVSPRESPAHGNHWGKQYVIRGESSKPEGVRDGVKRSPVYGGDAVRHSPSRDVVSESDTLARSKVALMEHRRMDSNNPKLNSAKDGAYSTNPERAYQKFETKPKAKEVDGAGIKKRSKILIKIPCKNNKVEEEEEEEENLQEEPLKIDEGGETDEVLEEGKINNMDEEIKTWNLRPRKPIRKLLNISGCAVKNSGASAPAKNKAPSPLRNLPKRSGEIEVKNGGGGEKKEKRKLSISVALSKEEIEEDIFALTGSKPARRPKKRAKIIQKQVDSVFPGLWLVGITAESYKVSENSLKG